MVLTVSDAQGTWPLKILENEEHAITLPKSSQDLQK